MLHRNAKVQGTIRRFCVFVDSPVQKSVVGVFKTYVEAQAFSSKLQFRTYLQHRNLICLNQQWHFVDDRPIPMVEGLYVKSPRPSIRMGETGWYFVEASGSKPTMTLWLRLKLAVCILGNFTPR